MSVCGRAFAWHFWHRFPWVTFGGGTYLTFLISAHAMIPPERWSAIVALCGLAPVLPFLLYLLMIFSFSEHADVFVKDSGYPAYLFRHPLTSRALAGWPMFIGATTIAAVWLATVMLVLRPTFTVVQHEFALDMREPIDWVLPSTLMMVCLLVWLQAVIWTTFPLVLLRACAAVMVVAGVPSLAAVAAHYGFSPAMTCLWTGLSLPAAYAAAVIGINRARHGDAPHWGVPAPLISLINNTVGRRCSQFLSPQAAQRCIEWHRSGRLMVLITFASVVLLSVLFCRPNFKGSVLIILLLPPYFSLFMAMALGGMGLQREQIAMSPFLACRPLSSTGFVVAKLQAAAWACLLSCTIAILGAVATLYFGGRADRLIVLGRMVAASYSGPQIVAMSVVVLSGYFVVTWLVNVQALFVKLCGRAWIDTVLGITVGAQLLGSVYFGLTLYSSQSMQANLSAYRSDVPAALLSLVLLKVLLASIVVRAILQRRLLNLRQIGKCSATWAGVCGFTILAVLYWIPATVAAWYEIVLGVCVMLPFSRLGLAPLAVRWNRHR